MSFLSHSNNFCRAVLLRIIISKKGKAHSNPFLQKYFLQFDFSPTASLGFRLRQKPLDSGFGGNGGMAARKIVRRLDVLDLLIPSGPPISRICRVRLPYVSFQYSCVSIFQYSTLINSLLQEIKSCQRAQAYVEQLRPKLSFAGITSTARTSACTTTLGQWFDRPS